MKIALIGAGGKMGVRLANNLEGVGATTSPTSRSARPGRRG